MFWGQVSANFARGRSGAVRGEADATLLAATRAPRDIMGTFLNPLEWFDSGLCWAFQLRCPSIPALFDTSVGIVYFWMLAFSNLFV